MKWKALSVRRKQASVVNVWDGVAVCAHKGSHVRAGKGSIVYARSGSSIYIETGAVVTIQRWRRFPNGFEESYQEVIDTTTPLRKGVKQ